MQESTFGFQRRPFASVPDPAVFFPAECTAAAHSTLARVIERGEGPGLLVGPAGVGKTLLCNLLEQQFQRDFRVVALACGQLGGLRSLLQSILHQLHQPYQGLKDGELRLALLDFLEPNDQCPNGLLLLVDEAHHLTADLLEELRMISNLVRDGQPRVRLVLSGNSKLEDLFTSPQLESFNQRLAARCYLEALSREETRSYVTELTTAAGGRAEIWTEDGLRAVCDATGGIPRMVNQLCDQALLLAASTGRREIGLQTVEEAWSNLQQLPAPWHDEASTAGETMIEFGALDESGEPTAAGGCEIELDPSVEDVGRGDEIEFGPDGIEFAWDDAPAAAADASAARAGDDTSGQNTSGQNDRQDPPLDAGAWGRVTDDVFVTSDVFAPSNDTVQYELAPQTAEFATEIEKRLADVELKSGTVEPPPPLQQPLASPSHEDPFGHFENEEVVLDQQLHLGQEGTNALPVFSIESQLLAEALTMPQKANLAGVSDPPMAALADADAGLDKDPAGQQEDLDNQLEVYDPPTVVPMFAASRDDRDLIIIEDDQSTEPAAQEGCRDVLEQLRGD